MARTKTSHPAPTVVLLVRHGQTPTTGKLLPGRAPGLHLAEAGVAQAQRAAERISALTKVDAIYASPLERARETAAPIAAARGLKTRIEKGLLECDFGDWTGAELKNLMKLPEWNTVQRAPSTFTFPGGESFTAMQNRIVGAIDRLRAAHPGAPSSVCLTPIPSRLLLRTRWVPTSISSSASSSVPAPSRQLRTAWARQSFSPSTPRVARLPSFARPER